MVYVADATINFSYFYDLKLDHWVAKELYLIQQLVY